MKKLLYIFVLLPCLMSGQGVATGYVKSYGAAAPVVLGDIQYGINYRRFGNLAASPMVNLTIPDPLVTGSIGTVTHWTSGSNIEVYIDSFPSATSWTSTDLTGTTSPSEFDDTSTARGIIIQTLDSALGMSVVGLSASTTYHLSMFVAAKSFGTDDFRVITSDVTTDYTNAQSNTTYSVEVSATTDGTGKLYWRIIPLDTGTGGANAELILYCMYIRED